MWLFFILLGFIFSWHIWQFFSFFSWKKNLLQKDKFNLRKKREKKKKYKFCLGVKIMLNDGLIMLVYFTLSKAKIMLVYLTYYEVVMFVVSVLDETSIALWWGWLSNFCCLWLSKWWWTSFWDWDDRFLQSQGKDAHFQFFIVGMIHDIHL